MKIYSILLCACLILCSTCLSCSSDSTESFTPTDPEARFNIKPAGVFEIVLKSNITTGYGWQFAEPLDESLLKMVEHRYVADTNPRGLVGVGGVEVWLFMGLKPGKTNVSLEYVRPWDSTSVAKTASFPVEIKE